MAVQLVTIHIVFLSIHLCQKKIKFKLGIKLSQNLLAVKKAGIKILLKLMDDVLHISFCVYRIIHEYE
jgi:hypothetical protein